MLKSTTSARAACHFTVVEFTKDTLDSRWNKQVQFYEIHTHSRVALIKYQSISYPNHFKTHFHFHNNLLDSRNRDEQFFGFGPIDIGH